MNEQTESRDESRGPLEMVLVDGEYSCPKCRATSIARRTETISATWRAQIEPNEDGGVTVALFNRYDENDGASGYYCGNCLSALELPADVEVSDYDYRSDEL